MSRSSYFLSLANLAASAGLVAAYSFEFQNTPTQCNPVDLQITGSDGEPPYEILSIPVGGSPLPNGTEVRRITSQNFTGSTVSLTLNYPADSQFVLVMSDANGFGTGGTSVPATVQSSSNSSCFNPSQGVSPDFSLSIDPQNQFVQCEPSRLFWTSDQVQGNVVVWGVIPGGDSFYIPVQNADTEVSLGTGFNYTVNVRIGTTLIVGAGDSRGLGTGGSVSEIVSQGINDDTSCISNDSPSSTASPYAGGSYPTSTSGDTTTGGNVNNGSSGSSNSGSSHSTNVGAIVGGVVGGVVGALAVILIVLFILRRKHNRVKAARNSGVRQTDLLEQPESPPIQGPQNDAYLRPEPFIVPPSELGHNTYTAGGYPRPSGEMSENRQSMLSVTSTTPISRTLTPGASSSNDVSSNSRKTPHGPPQLRAVNIIQHDDAGSIEEDSRTNEPETVELPPQYTTISRRPGDA